MRMFIIGHGVYGNTSRRLSTLYSSLFFITIRDRDTEHIRQLTLLSRIHMKVLLTDLVVWLDLMFRRQASFTISDPKSVTQVFEST